MAALLDMEARNGRTSSGPPTASSSTTTSSSYRKPRKAIIESDPEDDEPAPTPMDIFPPPRELGAAPTYSMDTDISQLEAPTFTTLDRGPSKTMMKLKWDHSVNLIGKKVVNPMIHCCDQCLKPILIYGRMIPCKHVFCFNCANSQAAKCNRCGDKVTRVEPVGLGSIYMCSHGGSRYGHNGCRRTYLSQRDLQAHIQHRHVKGSVIVSMQQPSVAPTGPTGMVAEQRKTRDEPRGIEGRTPSVAYHESGMASSQDVYRTPRGAGFPPQGPPPPQTVSAYGQPPPSQHISVIGGTRQSNLITVPIHDSNGRDIGVAHGQPPPAVIPGYPYGHAATVGGGTNFSQPPPSAASGPQQQQPQQHYYSQNQPASYSERSQTQYSSSQSSHWRTGTSNYYRR